MDVTFAGCVIGTPLKKQTSDVDWVGSERPDEGIKPPKHSHLPLNSVYIGIKPAVRMDTFGKSLHTLLYN